MSLFLKKKWKQQTGESIVEMANAEVCLYGEAIKSSLVREAASVVAT